MKTEPKEGLVASAESAELYRDVVALTIHDLGAISMALSLRADVLATILPASDLAALNSLSGQLTEMRSTLRLALGPRGSSQLAPERTLPAEQWWRVASRLSTGALPRGIRVQSKLDVMHITSQHASVLTHLWLAACKGLLIRDRSHVEPNSATLELSMSPRRGNATDAAGGGAALVATVTLAKADDDGFSAVDGPSRWLRYSNRVAKRNNAALAWWIGSGSVLEWKCEIG